MRRAFLLAATLALTLHGCIDRPTFRRPAATPVVGTDPVALRQCLAKLDRLVARYALLPDRTFDGGCTALGSVQLRDIGTPTTNLGAMTCPLAYAFTVWVQSDLQVPAMGEFASPVTRIETFGTYSCRPIAGTDRLSEHASANAVDVSAFVLEDGRRISVLNGWNGDEREARFLRVVRDSACRRFNLVLSPDYNAAHRDHFHFDMGRGPFCR
ncbi:MAG: extensin family protein [Sphingomonadaceae bacterium]